MTAYSTDAAPNGGTGSRLMGSTNDLAMDPPRSRADQVLQWVPRILSSKPLLATSLYDDPMAELHEDSSARLREHLALRQLLDLLRRSSPGVRRERPPLTATSRAPPITESDRFLGTLRCGSAALPSICNKYLQQVRSHDDQPSKRRKTKYVFGIQA